MSPHGNPDNTARATDAPSPRPAKVGCPPPDATAVPSHLATRLRQRTPAPLAGLGIMMDDILRWTPTIGQFFAVS